jgi:hypothetical protein
MPSSNDPGVSAAEELLWATLARDLERQGTPEAVLHLRHLLSVRLEGVAPEGRLRRARFVLHQRTGDYEARYSGTTGEPLGWYFSALAEGLDDALPPERALELARAAVELPPGAELVSAEYEEQGGERVFVARWRHVHEGVPVERDVIQVLVNGGIARVFGVHRRWHEVDERPAVR